MAGPLQSHAPFAESTTYIHQNQGIGRHTVKVQQSCLPSAMMEPLSAGMMDISCILKKSEKSEKLPTLKSDLKNCGKTETKNNGQMKTLKIDPLDIFMITLWMATVVTCLACWWIA